MALQDFTISFTTTHAAEFNDLSLGNISPPGTVFMEFPPGTQAVGMLGTLFGDLAALRAVGMLGTLFIDSIALNSIGMLGTSSASGIESLLIESDIIHYSEQSAFKAGEVVLASGVVVRTNNLIKTWGMESVKLNVINSQIDKILDVSESRSVLINNGAGNTLLWSLPENANAGIVYTFVRTSTSGLANVGTENDSGSILFPLGSSATGISLDSIGSKLSVISAGSNIWAVTNAQNITAL